MGKQAAAAPMTSETRAAAWRARLLAIVGGVLLFETITGLVIWLTPFSLTAQFMVLTHTVLGLLIVLPFAWYLTKHWVAVSRQRFSHHKITGYGSFAAIAVCLVSGVVLTIQSAFGTRISYAMDTIHVASTIALIVTVLVHLLTVIAQDKRRAAVAATLLQGARRRFGFASVLVALVCFGATAIWQSTYAHPSFEWKLPDNYGYSYGAGAFAPSLATTSTGDAVHPRLFSGSKSCGQAGCHEQIYDEWLPSAHRYASSDVAFQAVQKAMATSEGPESTRYCAGCHDPIALFSGSKNIYDEDLSSPGADEGVSCIACHRLMQTDLKGNASYTMEPPEMYAYEVDESPTGRFLSNFLIRALPQRHATQYSPPLLKSPEYCAACHKQFIDEEINDFGWVQLQNQYDNWRKSHWNREQDPTESKFCGECHERKGVEVPEGKGRCTAITTSCRECHMALTESTDPASGDPFDLVRSPDDGRHRDHRFIGANHFMPQILDLPGHEEQFRRTEAWLRGETMIPEIAHKWPSLSKAYLESPHRRPTPVARPSGPVLPIKLRAMKKSAEAGTDVRFTVEILSRKVGHDFPTGPLDVIQCWVETEVSDAEGKVLYHSGRLTKDGFIEPGSFVFKAEGVDAQGNLIDRHNLWELVGARFKRSLFPGFTDTARFEFTCPDQVSHDKGVPGSGGHTFKSPKDVKGPLTLKARLLYRKVNQHLLNIVTGRKDVRAPVTVIDTDELVLPLGGP